MANTKTVTAALRKEGFPLELVRGEGYHYFIFDTLDTGAPNRSFEERSEYTPRFGDLSPERWMELGRDFIRDLEEKGLWPLEDQQEEPSWVAPDLSEIAAQEGFDIPLERWDVARERLEKLQRKAKRYGAEEIGFTASEPFNREEKRRMWDGSLQKVTRSYVNVKVTGPAPRVGEHRFLARIEHSDHGNIVDTIPGEELPDLDYRKADPVCDHCQTARDRKETFLVQEPSGKIVQVGRTCLRDYLGTDNPANVLWRFQWDREARDALSEDERAPRARFSFSVLETITLTIAAVRIWGWCSKGQAQHEEDLIPTIDYVSDVLYAATDRYGNKTDARKKLEAEVRAEDWEEAKAIREWAMGGGAGDGDYGYNLAVLCAHDEVEPKRGGFVASAVGAKARADERELRKTRERKEAAKSGHVGEVGERLKDLELIFESTRQCGGGQWGPSYLMKFRDASGNIFSWFSSNCFALDIGQEIKLDGTVKAHTEYKGAKETQLTRCKLEEKVQ